MPDPQGGPVEPPCHSLPKETWCDYDGPGGFMGHTCKPRNVPTTDPRFPLAVRALATFGQDRQMKALGEEMAEATAAILRFLNSKGDLVEIREEMTDVESVLASLRDVLGTPAEWEAVRERKRAKFRAKLDSGNARSRPAAPSITEQVETFGGPLG